MKNLTHEISETIRATERYYREQIFSSGCSSMVSIYRITEDTNTVKSIKKQLQGSPYIQKGVDFSEKFINTMLDIQLYVFEGKHFFILCELNKEMIEFIDQQCNKISSFDEITGKSDAAAVDWSDFDSSIAKLADKFTVLSGSELANIVNQLKNLTLNISLGSKASNYLKLFQSGGWLEKKDVNYASLLNMLAMANQINLSEESKRDLVLVGLLKDIGYTRLHNQIDNFELWHPLVSHQIVSSANDLLPSSALDQKLGQETLIAIALHHEFVDGSGPLARLGYPLARKVIKQNKLPLIAQISGICDLYTSLLARYDAACAYSICLGFVAGQGDMALRYDQSVLDSFAETFREKSINNDRVKESISIDLLDELFDCFRDQELRNKAKIMVQSKCNSSFDQITLAINLLRNIAEKNPQHVSMVQLSSKLSLPEEFAF